MERFVARGLRPRHGVALFAVIVGAVLLALLIYDLHREYQVAIASAEVRTQNLTRVLEEHARQSLRRVELNLARASDTLKRLDDFSRADPADLQRRLRAVLPADKLVRAFAVIDRSGAILVSTLVDDMRKLPSVADRDYFIAHRDRSDLGMVIGATVKSRIDGTWLVPVSHRLTAVDGSFAGVLLAVVEPAYFQSFYDSINTGADGFVTLFVRGGWIAVRSPFDDRLVSMQWHDSPMFREHLPKSPVGTVRQVVVADGVERIYSYRALEDYPVIVALGLSLSEILADWRARLWRDGISFVIALSVLVVGASLLVRQLARREAAVQALRESEARFRSLIHLSSDWYWEQDAGGRYVVFEGAAYRNPGIPGETFLGKRPQELGYGNITPEEWAAHERAIQTHKPFHDFIGIRYRLDGSIASASSLSGEPMYDAEGHFIGYRGVGSDITERIRLEYELRRRERELELMMDTLERRVEERTGELQAAYRELESFSYSVSHDLRAPLRAIDGFASILAGDFRDELPHEAQRCVDRISEGARRMGALIDGLLQFARLSRHALKVRRVDPKHIVNEALRDYEGDVRKHSVAVRVGDLPSCVADPFLLRQVFANLLSNALKFSVHAKPPAIEVFAETQGAETVFAVRDNGAGFDPQYADKLFGVFQRLHTAGEFQGFGIGLALVRRIVERHGGRVWAESDVDQGATFFFTLGSLAEEPPAHPVTGE